MNSIEEKYAHDFDKIDQTNCDYGKEKVKILNQHQLSSLFENIIIFRLFK